MMSSARKLLASYGLLGLVRLFGWMIYTKAVLPNARLIRPPLYLRGRVGMVFDAGLTTGRFNRIEVFGDDLGGAPRLVCGRNMQINDFNHIAAIERITIGDDVLIASRVFITDHDHGRFDGHDASDGADVAPAMRPLRSQPVHIGHRVWIGEQVCILPGVTIGDGAVIGAGSVVTRDVPAGCVVVGNPARVLRRYDAARQTWERA